MATLRDNWIVIAISVAVIAALVLLIWLWWWIPKWQMQGRIFRGEKERADAEDNFRKTVGQALGGAAVLIGAAVAYLQFSQQQQAARDQLQAATDLRISNQVAKGFEQLASDKPTMRLGGIYGLEGVMNTPSDYHQPVLEALCAFVREGTIGMIVNNKPATDIQATLTVIGRRKDGPGQVGLFDANIPGANLIDTNLSGADLSRAHLSGARLTDANLSRAYLNDADLSGANLANTDLSFAELHGADLSGATLLLAHLSGTNLINANLSGAELNVNDLSGALLSGVHLSGAHLINANLSGADLSSVDLNGANLAGADLSDANLSGADLSDANLNGADLSRADLSDANLAQAQLDQACGKPPKLAAGSGLRWDSGRPCR